MRRRHVTAALAAAWLAGGGAPARAALTESDAASGIRAALQRAAVAAIATLGRTDGFLGNPQVRIELPRPLHDAARLLTVLGQGRQVDELVTAMNRAAEQAVPAARDLFVSTVKAISVEDALRLVRGSTTAVTEFFAAKTRAPLDRRFLPIVTQATDRAQLAQRYNAVAARAGALGLLKGDERSVQTYVTARALDGLYFMMGVEEKRIRADPVGTGSSLLRRVFGG
ncbi:MAG: DUF4197 domain-containing protein [Burkholderiales bacterium]|nr:DUF4197 domain-containing protein [Burkholderiales bacterium]